jgi:hypothetical protein
MSPRGYGANPSIDQKNKAFTQYQSDGDPGEYDHPTRYASKYNIEDQTGKKEPDNGMEKLDQP